MSINLLKFHLAFFCILNLGNLFALQFRDIKDQEKIYLYAGDITKRNSIHNKHVKFIGLSLHFNDARHIMHNVCKPFDLWDNSVDIFQSEDVFEHIEYDLLPAVLEEIYRVLKPSGFCRISVPDYRCDFLIERSLKDTNGNIVFDPKGGGSYRNGKVKNGGHVWFPTIESVRLLVENSSFSKYGKIKFLHFYNNENIPIMHPIDHSICKVRRTPDFDIRVQNPRRPLSLVVDLYKE